MPKTIVAKPNQSMPDIVIQALGSIEAGMLFCVSNDVSITDTPVPGCEYIIPDGVDVQNLADVSVTRYFDQTETLVGTLGSSPPVPLTMTIVLKPVLEAQYYGPTFPDAQGFYGTVLNSTPDFVNVHSLVSAYANDNKMYCQEEHDMYALLPPPGVAEFGALPMSAKHLIYDFPWTSHQKVWMWNPYSVGETATFEDVEGNKAIFAPVVVWLDNVPLFHEMMVAALNVEFVSSDGELATLRLTRSHPVSAYTNILSPTGQVNMSWILPGVVLYEDPLHPGDPDIWLADVLPGTHTFGVETEYVDNAVPFTLPGKSICTQVIIIS